MQTEDTPRHLRLVKVEEPPVVPPANKGELSKPNIPIPSKIAAALSPEEAERLDLFLNPERLADKYVEGRLDLNRALIKRPHSTFFIRYAGKAREGLSQGDLLVVERGRHPEPGCLLVILLGSDLVLAKLVSMTEQADHYNVRHRGAHRSGQRIRSRLWLSGDCLSLCRPRVCRP